MKYNTLGEFFVAVAMGEEPGRALTPEEHARFHAHAMEALAPTIAAIRAEQRRAEEDLAGQPLF
jgi:hypothetical protein